MLEEMLFFWEDEGFWDSLDEYYEGDTGAMQEWSDSYFTMNKYGYLDNQGDNNKGLRDRFYGDSNSV